MHESMDVIGIAARENPCRAQEYGLLRGKEACSGVLSQSGSVMARACALEFRTLHGHIEFQKPRMGPDSKEQAQLVSTMGQPGPLARFTASQ